jgi:hypothetical protein
LGIGVARHRHRHFLKHPIDCAYVEVHMAVQAGAEAVDKSDCANVQGRSVHLRRTGAVGLQSMRNDAQENAQHHVEHRPVALHVVAQPLGHRQHPLAHRQPGEDVVRQVCRRLHHAPGIARRAHAQSFAGIGHEVVVPAVITPGPGKDAALQMFAKSQSVEDRAGSLRVAAVCPARSQNAWCVVVALAVELTATGQLKPGLEVLGNGLVQQRTFGVARVVELGLGKRWPARV